MNVFVFDIETVPDTQAGRRLYQLSDELSDAEVAELMFHRHRQAKGGSEFLPHHLHQVVAISVVFRREQHIKVWSLGEIDAGEKEVVQRFFDGIEKFSANLVSWNGGGFDLPVLNYRALVNGVVAHRYWDTGENDQQMRWNNYLSRYHQRHTDLMDVLAMYTGRANAPLDDLATMLGFPGKLGMSGAKVWEAYHNGDIQSIRDYCESDVLNTYLLYLRFELMRGNLLPDDYQRECELLRQYLSEPEAPEHFKTFLSAWEAA